MALIGVAKLTQSTPMHLRELPQARLVSSRLLECAESGMDNLNLRLAAVGGELIKELQGSRALYDIGQELILGYQDRLTFLRVLPSYLFYTRTRIDCQAQGGRLFLT